MRHIIKFIDGFEIELMPRTGLSQLSLYTAKNSVLMYKSVDESDYSHPLFTQKVDLDGNLWQIDMNERRLKVYVPGYSSPRISYQFARGYANHIWFALIYLYDDNKLRLTGGGTDTDAPHLFLDSINKAGQSFPERISENPNEYKLNILSNHAMVYYSGNRTDIPYGGSASSLEYFINSYQIVPDETDPYSPGGESQPGHGDGTFDFTSTDIPIPSVPTISASDTGFLTLYNPDSSQLKSLANYLWAGAWDINNFRKLFADPMDAILGCQIIPYAGAHPTTIPASLVVGNLSTGVNMPACTEQYFDVECGTIQILPKWGAYLDFSPYSSLALYLPYIGVVEISPDDCMNGTIRVVYRIDILSGSCCVFVYCTSNGGQDGHVLYTFNGSCACKIPVTAGQYGNILVETFKNVSTILNGAMIAGSAKGAHAGGAAVGAVTNAISSAASTTQNLLKPKIMRSGDIGGSAGIMGIQKPYLILTIPKMCIPGQQNTYIGYPSFVTLTLGDLTGYSQIEVTHLNNMSCTQEEADEIISLLGSGVIF